MVRDRNIEQRVGTEMYTLMVQNVEDFYVWTLDQEGPSDAANSPKCQNKVGASLKHLGKDTVSNTVYSNTVGRQNAYQRTSVSSPTAVVLRENRNMASAGYIII